MKHKRHWGFWVFLIIYTYLKYAVAFEQLTSLNFVLSTAVMILLTAVLPYTLSYYFLKKRRGFRRYMLAFFGPLILGAIGLALYFYIFIAPSGAPVSIVQVLPRSVTPGLIMGTILLASTWLFRRKR